MRVHIGDEEFRQIVEKLPAARVVDVGVGIWPRRVLRESVDFVVDGADDPFALEPSVAHERIKGTVDAPRVVSGAAGMRKDILTVGHINDRIPLLRIQIVRVGRIYAHRAFKLVQRGVKILYDFNF